MNYSILFTEISFYPKASIWENKTTFSFAWDNKKLSNAVICPK